MDLLEEEAPPMRPMPGFRPMSRQNSTAIRQATEAPLRGELDNIPIHDLIKKNLSIKAPKIKDKKPESEENDVDGLHGDFGVEEPVNDDFVNIYDLDEDELKADGYDLVPDQVKSEFNEPAPRRFGSKLKKSCPRWKKEETDQFYKVLSMCGMDFSMISKFFPLRSRKMIVNKFRCEQKKSPEQIKQAISNPTPIDLSLFASSVGVDKDTIVDDFQKNKEIMKGAGAIPKVVEAPKHKDAEQEEEDQWEEKEQKAGNPQPEKEEGGKKVDANDESDDFEDISF